MNIKIPILLGDLINVIADFIKSKSSIEFTKLNPIASRLMILYFAQVLLFERNEKLYIPRLCSRSFILLACL